MLEKINKPKEEICSTQTGFKSFPFKGENFITHDSISLDRLNGKYVLIDFWATWCGPCLDELPNLKELYARVDTSRFEIISIVGDSSPEDLNRLIEA